MGPDTGSDMSEEERRKQQGLDLGPEGISLSTSSWDDQPNPSKIRRQDEPHQSVSTAREDDKAPLLEGKEGHDEPAVSTGSAKVKKKQPQNSNDIAAGHEVFGKPWRKAWNEYMHNGKVFVPGDDKGTGEYRNAYWPDKWRAEDGSIPFGNTLSNVLAIPGKVANFACNTVGFIANGVCKMAGGITKTIGKCFGKVADWLESGDGVMGAIGKGISAVTMRPLETACNVVGNGLNAVGDVIQDTCKFVGAAVDLAASLPASLLSDTGLLENNVRKFVGATAQLGSSPIRAVSNVLTDTAHDIIEQGERMTHNGSKFFGAAVQATGHFVEAVDKMPLVGPSQLATMTRQVLQGHAGDALKGMGKESQQFGYHMSKVGRSLVGDTVDTDKTRFQNPDKLGKGNHITTGESADLYRTGVGRKEQDYMNAQLDRQGTPDRVKAALQKVDGRTREAIKSMRTIADTEYTPPSTGGKAPKEAKMATR